MEEIRKILNAAAARLVAALRGPKADSRKRRRRVQRKIDKRNGYRTHGLIRGIND